MAQTDPVLLWLKKSVLLAACALLCLLCVATALLISMLLDVNQQLGSLRERTETVAANVTRLESSVRRVLEPELLAKTLQRGVEHQPMDLPVPPTRNATVQGEVAFLLDCIGQPGQTYEYEGKRRPAAWVQMKLQGKAVLLAGDLGSAEEFIERVAARTTEGDIYYVVSGEGGRTELQAWLRERLQAYRDSKSAEPAAEERAK